MKRENLERVEESAAPQGENQMFDAEELKLQPFFEKTASEMYGGDATEFLEWSESFGGEYRHADVNAAFRAFVEGYRLGKSHAKS